MSSISSEAQNNSPLLSESVDRSLPINHHYDAAYFKVDNDYIITVQNAKANSLLQFYKQQRYTQLAESALADAQGHLTIKLTNPPNFVMNVKSSNKNTDGGNKVQYFNKMEFNLQNLTIDKTGNQLKIRWKAATNPEENITYRLVRSNKGGDFIIVKEFIPSPTENWEDFEYATTLNHYGVYKLEVVKNESTVRYQSDNLFYDQYASDYSIYPSPASSELHIDFMNSMIDWAHYQLINSNGQVVDKGSLENRYNTISVRDLSQGNYVLILTEENGKQTTQIITRGK
jgi:hypothetical protein